MRKKSTASTQTMSRAGFLARSYARETISGISAGERVQEWGMKYFPILGLAVAGLICLSLSGHPTLAQSDDAPTADSSDDSSAGTDDATSEDQNSDNDQTNEDDQANDNDQNDNDQTQENGQSDEDNDSTGDEGQTEHEDMEDTSREDRQSDDAGLRGEEGGRGDTKSERPAGDSAPAAELDVAHATPHHPICQNCYHHHVTKWWEKGPHPDKCTYECCVPYNMPMKCPKPPGGTK
jgi:hypothetical protein